MNDTQTPDTYRAFCAYDHRGRAPGCGWERFVESETEAERLAEAHSENHTADYEPCSVETGADQTEADRDV